MISHLFRRPKKGGIFWFDAREDDYRWRESLGTRNRHEAEEKLQERLQHLEANKTPVSTAKPYRQLTVAEAITRYAAERRAQVSPRMVDYWIEQSRPLAKFFGDLKLKQFSSEHLSNYQNARLDAGKSAKTINGELSVLRQLLKHCKLWYRLAGNYKPVPNRTAPVGRALSNEEMQRLFTTAKSRPAWQYAYTASVLSAFCGLRSCEIKALQWKHIDFASDTIDIRRSKTPGGWRKPTLNTICRETLLNLHENAKVINAAEPEHHVFPWHGREQKIDPTRPITSWRSAWRSILKAADVQCRPHDLRHSAVTVMAEAGLPDATIMAQVGHISPQMLKHYTHIRRQAMNQAAAALEPTWMNQQHQPTAELVN